MKTAIFTSTLLLSTALGTVVPRAPKKVDYSGFKVIRVASTEDVKAQIESLAAHVLNPGKSAELDIVVSPQNVDALTALVAGSTVLNEDVGATLAEEGQMSAYAGSCKIPYLEEQQLTENSPQ
jgi:carboxypeptidase A2